MKLWRFSRSLSLAALLSVPALLQGLVPNIQSQAVAQQLEENAGASWQSTSWPLPR